MKTEAAPAQMSRFVRFTPESVQTKRTTGQVTSNAPPPSPPSQQTLPLAPQRAPFGARMGPIIQGKVIHGGTLRWKSLQRVDICSTSQSALCLRRSPHLSAVRPRRRPPSAPGSTNGEGAASVLSGWLLRPRAVMWTLRPNGDV